MRYFRIRVFLNLVSCALFLLGCSRSGKGKHIPHAEKVLPEISIINHHSYDTVPMIKRNGVYEIPTEVNGVKMFFIFDTGAGMISMSLTEANFLLKQGKLEDSDFLGDATFEDAQGNTSQNKIVNLREIKIGNRTIRNIKASIVPNIKAPLLFGQSALENFGAISIDYNRNLIIFGKQD